MVAVAAEAASAKETLQTQTASFSTQVEASAKRAVEVMEGRVQQLVLHTEAQMSPIAEEVTQRLECEIDAATMSAAMMGEVKSRDVMELMRHELQAQMEQNLGESHLHEENAQKSAVDIVAKLESLTQQLNEFHPMRESDAATGTE